MNVNRKPIAGGTDGVCGVCGVKVFVSHVFSVYNLNDIALQVKEF